MIARLRKTWAVTFRYTSARHIPGPPVLKLHCTLDRDPDRRVVLELTLRDREMVQAALDRFNDGFNEPRLELATDVDLAAHRGRVRRIDERREARLRDEGIIGGRLEDEP